MLQIIDDVLKAESEAEDAIKQAREKTQELLSALDREIHAREQKVRLEQSERVALEFAGIRKNSEEQISRKNQETRLRAERFLDDSGDVLNEVVSEAVHLILASPLNKSI